MWELVYRVIPPGWRLMRCWGDREMLGMQGPEDLGPNTGIGFGDGLEWG